MPGLTGGIACLPAGGMAGAGGGAPLAWEGCSGCRAPQQQLRTWTHVAWSGGSVAAYCTLNGLAASCHIATVQY